MISWIFIILLMVLILVLTKRIEKLEDKVNHLDANSVVDHMNACADCKRRKEEWENYRQQKRNSDMPKLP